ncbi:unnamed protein product [Orchesella dallaii]|uniref:DUF4806 domain-containing protein n=1 Tax=Orchesella dallaii TaxID=48710 RepID=A0ABP1Q3V3_9HEXA
MAEQSEKFCVVHFKIDDSVEVVPIKWLFSTDEAVDYCKFPPGPASNIVKLCSNPETDPRENWILNEGMDYKRAVRRAKKYIDNTDVETTDVEQNRQRKRRKIDLPTIPCPPSPNILEPNVLQVTGYSEPPNERIFILPAHQTVPVDNLSDVPGCVVVFTDDDNEGNNPNSANESIPASPQYEEPTATTNSKFQDEVLLKLAQLDSEFKEIKLLLLRLIANQTTSSTFSTDSDFPVFPVNNQAELTSLENWVVNKLNYDKLVIALSKIGGQTPPSVVYNILRYLLSTKFSTQLRLTTVSGKIAFAPTRTAQVIRDATRLFSQENITDTVISTYIGRWLRNSGDRGGGRKQRIKENGNSSNNLPEMDTP